MTSRSGEVIIEFFVADPMILPISPLVEKKTVILIVENDSEISSLLRGFLEKERFSVSLARDGNEALWSLRRVAARNVPLLTVVDLPLPVGSGGEIFSFIRNHRDLRKTPILAISGLGNLDVRIKALEEGADDFLEKPFGMREFLARIRMLIRCYHEPVENRIPPVTISFGPLFLNTEKLEISVAGQEVRLTRLEFRILHCLALNQGRIVTKEDLVNSLWGEKDTVGEDILKVHISSLRKKLGDSIHAQRFIETVRGFGYRLKKEPHPS